MGPGPGSWAAPFASTPRRLSAVRFSAHLWWENCHNLLTCATPRALSPFLFPFLSHFLPHSHAQPAAVSTLLLFFFVFLFSSLRFSFSFAFKFFFFFFLVSTSFFLSQRPRDVDSFGCLLVVLWYLIRICVAFICMTPPSITSTTSNLPFCTQKAYQFTSH